MRKEMLTALLCILVAVVVTVTGVLFIRTMKKPQAEPPAQQQEQQTPADDNISIGESDTQINSEPDSSQTTEPTPNESEMSETTQPDTPVNNEPDSDANDTPSAPVDDEPDTPTSNTPDEPETTLPDTSIEHTSMPQSYTDFSVTKGLSAKEAYEKLDAFLNSKYSILINKQNKVESTYAPTNLIIPSGCQYQLEAEAANALTQMLSAARQSGITDLVLYSGYRTYASQKNKFETRTQKYLNQGYSLENAQAKAGEYIAPPGSSEHHTGLAADVCSSAIVNRYGYLSDDFDSTKEYSWMSQNCYKYGFIVRYKKGSEAITGFLYEPWHLRYLGVEHATACTQLNITYEEYYSLLVKLRDMAKSDAGV